MGDDGLSELQALDAVAAERGMALAFRVCEQTDDLEPVFMHVALAGEDGGKEAALIAISDENGLLLGRYVIPRERLADALEQAESIEDAEPDPMTVPADWQRA